MQLHHVDPSLSVIFRVVSIASMLGAALGYGIALFIALAGASPSTFAASAYVVALTIPWILTIFWLNRKFARDYPDSFFGNAPLWTKIVAVLSLAVILASTLGGYYIGDFEIAEQLTNITFYLGVAAMWCLLLPVIYALDQTPNPS